MVPILSSALTCGGCVLTTANFGTAALPDIDRAVPGDAEATGNANRALLDVHTILIHSSQPGRRLPSYFDSDLLQTMSSHQQHSRGRNLDLERGKGGPAAIAMSGTKTCMFSGPIGTVLACGPATGLLQGTGAKRVVPNNPKARAKSSAAHDRARFWW